MGLCGSLVAKDLKEGSETHIVNDLTIHIDMFLDLKTTPKLPLNYYQTATKLLPNYYPQKI